ncbi:MAG: regulatory protein RecX [Candidatus Omnitrophota bacterium]
MFDIKMNGFAVKCRKYVLRLIALRARSAWEIENRLKKAGYDNNVRISVITALKQEKFIDDVKFAKEWVDSRLRLNPRAVNVIRAELVSKGVSEDIIEQTFLDKSEQLDDHIIALRLIENKFGFKKKVSLEEKGKIKLFRFLLSKGFDAELAEEVIQEKFRE